ncbi:MAG: ABC transporter ATP-binding protein [Gemmatimonadota bacterium]
MTRIVVDRVWKKFRRGETHDSLRDLVEALARRMLGGRKPDPTELGKRDFWAVRDLSFEVEPGQALGIIGPNGSGKSTVLKLLTGILRPTAGRIHLSGRIGALIEVAAGFHADLTGRENVFLQGAIMGMRRAEIGRRFDEIVEFSGIAPFIDTPVKRYSSGMNARLGFSLAAHLDPDILIIDEVLAVGDFAFQQRAFAHIGEMARRNIPVVIVSHQLDRIASLCTTCILLKQGEVVRRGTPAECISQYVQEVSQTVASEDMAGLPVRITALNLATTAPVKSGEPFAFSIEGAVHDAAAAERLTVAIRVSAANTGQLVYAVGTGRMGITFTEEGPFRLAWRLDSNVPAGIYSIETMVYDSQQNRRLAAGPSAYMRVEDPIGFSGPVQLSAEARLSPIGTPVAR